MPPSVNDKFRLASGSTRPVVTTLALPLAAGSATAEISSATGWNTTTGLDYVIFRRQINNLTGKYEEQPGTRISGRATLTGTTLSGRTVDEGTEPPAGYAADGNTVVLCAATAQWADDFANGILNQHKQSGAHAAITTDSILNAGNYSQSSGTFSVPAGSIKPEAISTTDPSGAWTSYVPAWSNFTAGNGVVDYAKYNRIGKQLTGRLKFTLGTTSAATGSPIKTSTPINALSYGSGAFHAIGTGLYYDASVNIYYPIGVSLDSASTLTFYLSVTTGTYGQLIYVDNVGPATPATNDFIQATFTYETA